MSLNLEEKKALLAKKEVVSKVAEQVVASQTIVLAEYRGINAAALTELRARARNNQVYLRVLKNTLVRRAVEGTIFAALAEQMSGPLIYAMSADAVAAAKIIHTFAKENDKLVIKAGCYAGTLLDASAVQALANIPSRDELIARLLGVMQAPVSGFARCLAELAKQKEGAAG